MKDTQLLFHYNVHTLCNGVLAGLVSVTAGCARIELWSAAIIGIIGSMIFLLSKKLIQRNEIDDPMDISEIHGVCGWWSIIAVGIFDVEEGLIYTGMPSQLSIQIVGGFAYALWSGLISFFFFYALKQN
jgi:Amt family ammonium transporter